MKRLNLIALAAALLLSGTAFATDTYLPGNDNRFQLTENKSGGGFYWTDTSSGHTWLMSITKKEWVYCGHPPGATSGDVSMFMPYCNRNGRGVFILNTQNGKGWFYDGKKWTALGKPSRQSNKNSAPTGY